MFALYNDDTGILIINIHGMGTEIHTLNLIFIWKIYINICSLKLLFYHKQTLFERDLYNDSL